MLVKLKIENVALIEIIEINFEKGLNIITGDSGSGKSLILDSLNALFGGTNIPLKHLIRPGKDFCVIEAIFSSSNQINNWLISNGFEKTSSELQIKRKSYKKNNKILSKYRLNDLPISRQSLEKLRGFLIDSAGQSDTFIFDSLDKRRLIIDDLCSQEFRETSERIKSIWGETKVLKGLMDEKIEFSRNQEEKNLAIKHMLKSLEEADLNSNLFQLSEIVEIELINNDFNLNKVFNWYKNQLDHALRICTGEDFLTKDYNLQNGINLTTIHSSKGLEFDLVLCPYLSIISNKSNKIKGPIW